MKHKILRGSCSFAAMVMFMLFIQSNVFALTVVLKQPVPLQQETMANLKQENQNVDDRWKLVMFGFTHCKDVCPLSLANFSMLVRAAAAEQIQLEGTFVSVDPDRDTDDVLSSYTNSFGPNVSFLRLEDKALERFMAAFGAEALFYTKNEGNQFNYQVDHSSTAFLIDPEGRIRVLFDALEDARDIEKMLRENQAFFKS